MTNSTYPSSSASSLLPEDTTMLQEMLIVFLIFIPSLGVFLVSTLILFRNIFWFLVNYDNLPDAPHATVSSETLHLHDNATSDTANQTNTPEDTNKARNNTPLPVDDALLLLAAAFQDKMAHLTRTEAKAMLNELHISRSTMGSHVPILGREQSSVPVDAFDKDAWYGDACLIDAVEWWLKRRYPGDNDDGQGNDNNEAMVSGFAGFPEERIPKIVHEHSQPRSAPWNQNGDSDMSPSLPSVPSQWGGTNSSEQASFDPREINGILATTSDPHSASFIEAHTTGGFWQPKQHSTESSPATKTRPFYHADQVVEHVTSSLQGKLYGLPISEIDDLVAMLKVHRKKTASKRDKAILGNLRNSAVQPQMPFADKRKSWQKMKMHWDAKVGLVDGVLLIIRQTFCGSEDAVYEESFYGSSPTLSVGSFTWSDR